MSVEEDLFLKMRVLKRQCKEVIEFDDRFDIVGKGRRQKLKLLFKYVERIIVLFVGIGCEGSLLFYKVI